MPKIIFRPTPIPRPPFPPPTPVTGPLTFTAKQNGCRIGYIYYSEDYAVQDAGLNIEYSLDGGETWNIYTMATDESQAQMITLNNGETAMFRGNNANLAYYLEDDDDYQATKFIIEGQMAASGDVSSLLNGIGGVLSAPTYCYAFMFSGCLSLTKAPNLPATTLANDCYYSMFDGCTSLTQAPILPATTMADSCYAYMFSGCTSLTQAPALPATTMADSCYSFMFNFCTSLTQFPSLPATILASNCYKYMFGGCSSLTQAPTLPATTLANHCYNAMFKDCTSLTQAPDLPATTMADSCYVYMFSGCTSLTQAPTLPSTTLVNNCYNYMFNDCTSLMYIEALFTTTPDASYTNKWVNGVAQNGTFVKSSEATWDVSGVNGIPEGWTVRTN